LRHPEDVTGNGPDIPIWTIGRPWPVGIVEGGKQLADPIEFLPGESGAFWAFDAMDRTDRGRGGGHVDFLLGFPGRSSPAVR
jgi:hypothetical protein